MSDHAGSASGTSSNVHRIEVRPSDRAGDPLAAGVLRSARALGVACHGARTARVYLVQGDIDAGALERVRTRLLTDPVLETSVVGASPARAGERIIEVHPLPGVMDPAAQTVRDAIRDLTGARHVEVVTGTRYDLAGLDEAGAAALSRGLLANGVIEQVHHSPWTPRTLPRAKPADQTLRRVALTTLSDDQLMTLSRQGHLFLSLAEMKAVQAYYLAQGREPTDIELETIAQTWSEHCVHKTLKSTITYRAVPGAADSDPIDWSNRPNHTRHTDGSVTIKNLLKSTVAAATFELIKEGIDWTLSVFVDNAGVIAFDERHAINVKVETHNRPSAIEPYGGAATGIGGCIRDVIGTGLGARPIAATDVFCVADPREFGPGKRPLPPGVLEPRRVLTRVVDGVRDYGNRMGIPTLSGAVAFDDRYVANPLVFCGCIGLMDRDKVRGEVHAGDRIIAMGGRTGRDGIHGATFSSAELTDTHADEFSHAVQIGNAIEEKRLLDAILRARDAEGGPLFHAITDCGAGGFSSAVGEMGKDVGAEVHLDRAPLKYEELRYDEIWISESQERMVLAVPEKHVGALRAICEEEGVELADLGVFGTPTREIVLRYKGAEVGRLSAEFLHEGIPMPVREAAWDPASRVVPATVRSDAPAGDVRSRLLSLLAHPNIASKRWIIRQYDHEVQGNTVLKPLIGPGGVGPGDASVIQPVAGSSRGLAISCGLATSVGDPRLGGDAYLMALAAIDECVRNLVCVGGDPSRTAILDNFCWPGCDNAHNLAMLVRAAEGCYDGAKAYRTPFISGKDSLHNQFRYTDPATGKTVTIEIPPTLLITGVAIVDDVSRCVTMDAKRAGDVLLLVGATRAMARHASVHAGTAAGVARAIRTGAVRAAHDCSEGGVGVAIAEMLIAGDATLGATINAAALAERDLDVLAERPGLYVLEVEPASLSRVTAALGTTPWMEVGALDASGALNVGGAAVPQADLRKAFLGTLDW
jgi:phosphoribosylformylglycinamidine synthase subunit PurSL